MRPVILYVLYDPRDGLPRYVGKTCRDLRRRYAEHLCLLHKHKRYRERNPYINWMKALGKVGMAPTIQVLMEIPYGEDWEFWERYFIQVYRSVHPYLKNASSGGDGGVVQGYRDEKWRSNLSKALSGRRLPPSTREKLRTVNTGKRHSEDTKRKVALNNPRRRGVTQLTLSGGVIAHYESAKDAQRHTAVSATSIRQVCMHGVYKTAGGFLWRYEKAIS